MRFIFNFFLFGIIFYLIYLFFPDAFTTLVSWANKTVEFFQEVFVPLSEKSNAWRGQETATPAEAPAIPPHQALLLFLGLLNPNSR